jgi:hypothetical protein
MAILEQENEILRQTVQELERENEMLERSSLGKKRIIMEQFEGAGQTMVDSNGQEIDPTWWDSNGDNNEIGSVGNGNGGNGGDPESQSFHLGLTNRVTGLSADDRSKSSSINTNDSNANAMMRSGNMTISYQGSPRSAAAAAAVAVPPPLEECDEFSVDACPIEPDISFKDALKDRAYWLVGLLALQSMSGFILARNEMLVQTHPVIVYFLTMLVGAGGNAGNQAAVRGE